MYWIASTLNLAPSNFGYNSNESKDFAYNNATNPQKLNSTGSLKPNKTDRFPNKNGKSVKSLSMVECKSHPKSRA